MNDSLFGLTVNSLSHFSNLDIAFLISSFLIKFFTGLCGLKKGAMLIALPNDIFPASQFSFAGLPQVVSISFD